MAEGAALYCGVLCKWSGAEEKEDQEMGSKKCECTAERSGSCSVRFGVNVSRL